MHTWGFVGPYVCLCICQTLLSLVTMTIVKLVSDVIPKVFELESWNLQVFISMWRCAPGVLFVHASVCASIVSNIFDDIELGSHSKVS